jgi:hypothetical protein
VPVDIADGGVKIRLQLPHTSEPEVEFVLRVRYGGVLDRHEPILEGANEGLQSHPALCRRIQLARFSETEEVRDAPIVRLDFGIDADHGLRGRWTADRALLVVDVFSTIGRTPRRGDPCP